MISGVYGEVVEYCTEWYGQRALLMLASTLVLCYRHSFYHQPFIEFPLCPQEYTVPGSTEISGHMFLSQGTNSLMGKADCRHTH